MAADVGAGLPPGTAPGHEEASSPLGHPQPVTYQGTGFGFTLRQDDGTPVAYDPCRPIHYVTRTAGQPRGGAGLVRAAVQRLSAVTGLRFVDDGATDQGPSRERQPFQPGRYGDRWVPVLIAWLSASENPDFAADVEGEAGSLPIGLTGTPGRTSMSSTTLPATWRGSLVSVPDRAPPGSDGPCFALVNRISTSGNGASSGSSSLARRHTRSMTAEPLPFFSFEEYLRLDEVSTQRHEWVAGQVYAMSGGTDRHLATTQALFERIAPSARRRGCRPWMADRRLRTELASYYPDLFVVCGPRADRLYETDAVLVVEVLSPSTTTTDLREKAAAYATINSIEQYVIVDAELRSIRRGRLDVSRVWQWEHLGATARLELLGADIDLAELWSDVDAVAPGD